MTGTGLKLRLSSLSQRESENKDKDVRIYSVLCSQCPEESASLKCSIEGGLWSQNYRLGRHKVHNF